MPADFHDYDDDDDEPKERDNLFLWTVFILLLIGVAFACWLGSFYIFGHPEKPGPYRFLQKFKKIEAPVRFEVTKAPQGKFVTPKQLFERYGTMGSHELEEENARLLRDYIKNYRETKVPLTYVTGSYTILDAYDLRKTDMFPSGVVAVAQAEGFQQVVIEHLYPAAARNVAPLRTLLRTGVDLKIERTKDLSALLHVERLPDGYMQFTVVPLLYGNYAVKGTGSFSLEPPAELTIETGFPVVRKPTFDSALKKFAEYRRTHNVPGADGAKPPKPELVRVDSEEPVVATPPPVPVPARTPPPTPVQVAGKGTTPRPAPTPAISVTKLITPPPRAMPIPPAGVSPGGVPLKPFVEPQRDPNSIGVVGSWKIYQPGKAPAGRTISASDAAELSDRGEPTERTYLHGEFRVTASDKNRAIMRELSAGVEAAGPRIIVDYPAGAVPPPEGSTTARDTARPLLIRSVQRDARGNLNIYAAEIIQQ